MSIGLPQLVNGIEYGNVGLALDVAARSSLVLCGYQKLNNGW